MGSLVLAHWVLLVSPFSLLVRRLPFCQRCLISHSYCEHMAVVKLVCGDATVSVIYGLFVAFMVVGFDVFIISVSYAIIPQAVLRLLCTDTHLKFFSTYMSHFCVILEYYIPAFFMFLTHRFGHNVPHHVHIRVGNLYLLTPPVLNTVVDGMKTKLIRERVLYIFQQKVIWAVCACLI
ncbi:olfactory receptor 52L1-like [Terrapene carolina triunguis]|uniref:olfactory receptor 52L1-like n=1 Tax=Terrapene triunguis TaxID=2587831 RepID=UPI000E77785E|nr:olfactory receptor 52L1-like [Terrapene carolina triunguis]